MKEYNKILELTDKNEVRLADDFKKLLHTHLVLGQTRHVCRYGTLSDGHEKITPAQRYYQAYKEMYNLAKSIRSQKIRAKMLQADLIEAENLLRSASRPEEVLRAEAKHEQAVLSLEDCLVVVEDQLRMLDEYNLVRLELMPDVEARYPNGVEQAELDNWVAVAEYRLIKEETPGLAKERLDNVPLPPGVKAMLGRAHGRLDAIAPSLIENKEKLKGLDVASPLELLDSLEVKNGIL